MTQNQPDRPLGLSTAQIAGSAMAAMTGAFVASAAGTTGTLVGAAVGSVIATTGAATYTWSLRRTARAVARTANQVRQTALTAAAVPTMSLASTSALAVGGAAPPPQEEREVDPIPAPSPGDDPGLARALPWGRLALASVFVLLATLAGITVIETTTGRPIAALIGGSSATGTTLGHATGVGDRTPTTPTTPTPTTPRNPAVTPSAPPASPTTPAAPAPSATPGTTVPSPAAPQPTIDPSLPPTETQTPDPAAPVPAP